MKEDEWILQIGELNTQDAEASFVFYFQLKKNNVSFFVFFRKGKKAKSSLFLPSYVISFMYVFSLLKKSFCLLPTCLVFSAICQNLTVNFWFNHLFSTHDRKSNCSKYSVCGFLTFISILKPFIPNPSLKIWQHDIIFSCLVIK